MRRDFWEPSEGRGSHSSLRRRGGEEEEWRSEVAHQKRRRTHINTLNKENRAGWVKNNNLQVTLVNFIKLESGQTHPANVFGGFHVFLPQKEKAEDVTAHDEIMSAGLLFAHLSGNIPVFAL